ncbi:MAG TPA: RNA methyltransferase [Syntrophales bacterium]|nr:RNA methyltransferase [Syntrophales bacterium]
MKLLRPLKSQLKLWEKLSQSKYRRQEGLFMAEGYKVVQELLQSFWKTKAILVMEGKRTQWNNFLSTVAKRIDVYGLSGREWNSLSQDKAPEGIMAVAAKPPQADTDELLAHVSGHVLLLYQINNPNNLGAIVRTAHWFGIETIILSIGSADFTNPKVVRSSMGSLFHLRMIAEVDFAEIVPRIKERHFLVGSSIRKGILPHPCKQDTALILGSESHGLPDALLRLTDEQWFIYGTEKADSLSLPQAASIMMYECTKEGTGIKK